MNKLIHTPEGVRDIYSEEYKKRQYLQNRILDRIHLYGYENIQTPTFEFFDVFAKEMSMVSAKELFKFFDRDGNTLVLRPDFTPSIARACAKYFTEDIRPIRLSYLGNVFSNNSNYQGRLKETTQLGVELIGVASLEADAEILAMACESLLSVGLEEFKISIGHASILRGLVEAANFNDDEIFEIKEFVLNKNFFGLEDYLTKKNIDSDLKELFSLLRDFYSSPKEFAELKEKAKRFERLYLTFEYFEKLYNLLEAYKVSEYVSFEMGLISEHEYYTGVIFSGYTYGSGEPIVKGGRYDKLLSHFGKDAFAIGFAISVDGLQIAVDNLKISVPTEHKADVILYQKKDRANAIEKAKTYRDYGKVVQMIRYSSKEELERYKELYAGDYIEVIGE